MKAFVWFISIFVAAGWFVSGPALADSRLLAVEEGPSAPPAGVSATTPAVETPLEKGSRLLTQGKFDQAVMVLDKEAGKDPYRFETNVLLGKALLGQCEKLKRQGNKTYKTLVHRPYQIGQRLYRTSPTRPEPYYLVAKSLVINHRPRKAGRTIKKAIHFAGPKHPDYAEYHLVLGDAWMGIMANDQRGYAQAKKAYQTALAEKSDDPKFVETIEQRLKMLDFKSSRLP